MDSPYGGQSSREQLMKRQLIAFRASIQYLTYFGLIGLGTVMFVFCSLSLNSANSGTEFPCLEGDSNCIVPGVDPDGGARGYLFRWTAFLLDL